MAPMASSARESRVESRMQERPRQVRRFPTAPLVQSVKVVGLLMLTGLIGQAACSEPANLPMLRRRQNAELILSYEISPDGKEIAEVRVEGAASASRMTLGIVSLNGRDGGWHTLFSSDHIGSVHWVGREEVLFSRTNGSNELVAENTVSGVSDVVFKSARPFVVAAVDPGRRLVAIETADLWRWRHRASVRDTDSMTSLELISPAWARWPGTFVVRALEIPGMGSRRKVRTLPLKISRFSMAPTLMWHRGHLLAVTSTLRSWETRIFDLESGRRVFGRIPVYRILSASVSPAGTLAVAATGLWRNKLKPRCGCGAAMRLYTFTPRGQVHYVSAANRDALIQDVAGTWWADREHLFEQVMGSVGPGGANRWWLQEIDTRGNEVVRRFYWPGGDLGGMSHECEFDAARTRAICTVQTLSDPPRLVVVDLHTGSIRVLGRIDSHEHRLHIKFKDVRLCDRFGQCSISFLALPRGADVRPVPLAVMAYGFTEAYSRDAQWITSYPVAKMVRAGIAVLLMNWVPVGKQHLTSFNSAMHALESAVSLFSNAVPAVEAQGVRVSRAMAMGWSFGGLFAAHAIQTLREYSAAEVGDPAAYNVTQFALGNNFVRQTMIEFFGGPPVGRFLPRYRLMDPAGDGRAANGPVLFEFVSRNPGAGQFVEEWRSVGTEVEAFAYRHSVHALNVPAEANLSRLRNLYWTKLNLFGPRSVTASELKSVGLNVPDHGWWNSKWDRERPADGSRKCRSSCRSRLQLRDTRTKAVHASR